MISHIEIAECFRDKRESYRTRKINFGKKYFEIKASKNTKICKQ